MSVLLVALGLAGGLVAGRLLRAGLAMLVRRSATTWDDVVLARLEPPLAALCMCAGVALVVQEIGLSAAAAALANNAVRVACIASIFWAAWRLVDIGRQTLAASRWAARVPASRSLVPLGARVTKVLVAALGFVVALSSLGYPVASLLAGLGIGGLAVALAAQKTVE
ncbi:MAG: mechanosensitive ion channel family protein, partial [Gemmatimonadaceae bacterium]